MLDNAGGGAVGPGRGGKTIWHDVQAVVRKAPFAGHGRFLGRDGDDGVGRCVGQGAFRGAGHDPGQAGGAHHRQVVGAVADRDGLVGPAAHALAAFQQHQALLLAIADVAPGLVHQATREYAVGHLQHIAAGVVDAQHLLHAIGHHVLAAKKNPKVAYLSCERFMNEFIEGLQNNSLPKFRKKYRQLDLLLLDDIQFLSGKERIQEEFFHTFNALHEARKQIVLSCDRPASEIQGLEQRLIDRKSVV